MNLSMIVPLLLKQKSEYTNATNPKSIHKNTKTSKTVVAIDSPVVI
jgi:hypothetical protein